jgi:hypothetical protein
MKFRLAILFSLLICIYFSQPSVANWKTDVKIDGVPNEWNSPLRFYDAETKLFFAFANDSSNFYLCLQSNDKRNQVKIHMAGMKVFINTKGKEKHKTCIAYPLTDSRGNFAREELNEEVEPDIESLKGKFQLQNTNMLTSGFATQNGNFPIRDSAGIHAALNWDEKNVMTYEVAIPLKELFGLHYITKDLATTITLILEVNSVTREDSQIDASQTAMGSASGSQTNGMTRTLPSGTAKEKRPLFDKNRCKQKLVLAQVPK